MKNAKMLSFYATICLLLSNVSCALASDPLEGRVKQNGVRISRPLAGASAATQTPLTGLVNEAAFNLKSESSQDSALATGASPLAAHDDQATLSGRSSTAGGGEQAARNATLDASSTHAFSLNAGSTSIKSSLDKSATTAGAARNPHGGGAKEQPVVDDYNAKKMLSGSITFRFCYYDLGDGAECAWEGLRDANYLLGRGVDIAIMLDRGGVRMANRHNMQEYQLHRGSTETMVNTQKLLHEFIDKGGKVYASERWCRTFGLYGGSYQALTTGVELLGDEEMADMLVERSGRIVEY